MNDVQRPDLDEENTDTNSSANQSFESVIQDRVSRRQVLSGTAGAAAIAVLGGLKSETAAAHGSSIEDSFFGRGRTPRLNFAAIAKNLEDTVTVPRHYSCDVLYALGDPITGATPDFRNDGTDPAASFAHRAGDHHDGMHYFGLGSNGKHLAAQRQSRTAVHESRGDHAGVSACGRPDDRRAAFATGGGRSAPRNSTCTASASIEVAKRKAASAARGAPLIGTTSSVRASIVASHTLTPMKLSGPAARTAFMKTKVLAELASMTRGTINNCAQGSTPWGTYLTCEENWAGYFRRDRGDDDPIAQRRSGLRSPATALPGHRPRALVNRHAGHDPITRVWPLECDVSSAHPRTAATISATWPTRSAGSSRSIRSRRLRRRASARHWDASRARAHRSAREGRRAPGLVHGRRFAQRVLLQVRLQQALESPDANGGLSAATSIWMTVGCTSPSSCRRLRAMARAALRHQRHHGRQRRPTRLRTRRMS